MNIVKKKNMENLVVDYDALKEGETVFDSHKVLVERKSPVKYVISSCVDSLEKSIVASPKDPLYIASNTIARRIVDDRTTGSILALGFYYVLKRFSRTNEDKDSGFKLLGG